jgi:hypothetical protein
VVVIVQENRTPDNLFHGLPNADIANRGLDSKGETVPLVQVSLVQAYDINHSHRAFVQMYDSGKMDGADLVAQGCQRKIQQCPPHPQFCLCEPG